MNQKTLFLAAGILAGAAVVYFLPKALNRGGENPAPVETIASEPANPAPAHEPAPVVAPEAPPEVKPALVKKAAPAPVSAWAKLAEKYGAEKTALSSKITSNLTSVINDGIKLAETAARNSGTNSLAETAGRDIVRGAAKELALTDEQKEKATAIMQSAVAKRMTAITDLATAMEAEPEQMMELFLAGDALARKEITQEEYDRITQPTRTMLQNLSGFVMGQPGGGRQALTDAETTSQLNAILSTEQQAKLAEMTARFEEQIKARQEAQKDSGLPFQPGQIPILELDKLDQSVASIRQMTEAARLMMEAMKGLKEANANTTPR